MQTNDYFRYIEIFQSTCDEIMDTLAKSCRQKAMIMRPRPYDYMDNFNIPMGGGGGGGGFRGGMMGGGNTSTGLGRGRFTRGNLVHSAHFQQFVFILYASS